MRKAKLLLVAFLSLLIVLAPVSSVLANTKPAQRSRSHFPEKGQEKAKSMEKDSVFQKIESQGGNEVSDKRLDREKGEGPFGALAGAIAGAALSVWDDMTDGENDSWGEMAHHAALTAAAVGAFVGTFTPW